MYRRRERGGGGGKAQGPRGPGSTRAPLSVRRLYGEAVERTRTCSTSTRTTRRRTYCLPHYACRGGAEGRGDRCYLASTPTGVKQHLLLRRQKLHPTLSPTLS
jgi:hypothetical protein